MKVLFSADWHIKLGQKNVPKKWQIERYKLLYKKIYELESQCDIHILGGDIFDNIPNPEEIGMFFDFIGDVSIPTFIYDGNHEATKKGQTFLKYLDSASNKINSNIHIICGITEIHGMDIIPYTHLKKFKSKDFSNRILCTHVRGSIPPHVIPEIDLDLLNQWDIVLAGDLHSYSNSQLNIIYPGSPLAITFHRSKITNGVIIFDTETLEHEWIDLELPQLIRATVSSEAEVIPTTYDHTIYEITGNILELSNVDTNSTLIDKKVISKKSETVLNLKDISLVEELELYLRTILELGDSDVEDILKVFNDYYKGDEME